MNGGIMKSQRDGAAAITGGTINGAVIGGTTPAAITGTTITGTTAFRAPDGTAGVPSYAFTSNPDNGLRIGNGGVGLVVVRDGVDAIALSANIQVAADGKFGWTNAAGNPNATTDVELVRDAANTLALKLSNSPQTFNHYAGNGSCHGLVAFNELLTIAAAASTDSALTIPAGAQIVAVPVRVTTIIPTAATFTVTAATGGTTFNTAAVAVAAGTTDAGTAAGGATYTAAGTKIRITPNLTPGAATGVVRICGYYRLITPPTS